MKTIYKDYLEKIKGSKGVERILFIASALSIALLLPLIFILFCRIENVLLEKEANIVQNRISSYALSVSEEADYSLRLMSMTGAMISDKTLSTTDAYAMLSSSDPNAVWMIYTEYVGSTPKENAIFIGSGGEYKILSQAIFDEKLSLNIQKQELPSCIKDSDDELYLIDPMTGSYADNRDGMGIYNKKLSVSKPGFKAYPDKWHLKGTDICYFDAKVPNSTLLVRYYTTLSDLKSSYAGISAVVKYTAFVFIALVLSTLIHINLKERKLSRSEEIYKAKEQAEKANAAKNMFLANMSHEIRTPINSILGLNEIIIRETNESTIKGYAQNIKIAGSNLLSLINDILDFSRIEQGSLTFIEKPYELSKVIAELYTVFDYRAKDKGLNLEFNIDESIPGHLTGDSVRVQQVFSNLLSNAIKYTDRGRVVFSLSWKDCGSTALLVARCEDTGRGMKAEEIPEIFDKFTRLDMNSNNSIEGTGLGLAITKEIIDTMKGEINIESVYGSGSIFTVSLPQKIHLNKPIGHFTPTVIEEDDSLLDTLYIPDAKLLLVDDTELNVKVTKRLIEPTGAHIDTALSGLECISRAEQESYDIIFMDDRMPQMDGTETLQRLLGINAISEAIKSGRTKVIMMTANVLSGAKDKYIQSGFTDYLPKPVSPETLYKTLKQYLPADYIKDRPVQQKTSADNASLPIAEQLKDIEGLDVEKGIKNCGGEDIYKSTIQDVTDYAESTIEEIEGYLKDKDIKNCTIKFHALKSTARLIGALTLSEHARLLEDAGDAKDMDYIKANAEPVLKEYKDLIGAIKSRVHTGTESNAVEPVNEEAARGIFDHMYPYAEDFNDDALLSMTKAIERYSFPSPYDEAFLNIKKYLRGADWEGIYKEFKNLGYE